MFEYKAYAPQWMDYFDGDDGSLLALCKLLFGEPNSYMIGAPKNATWYYEGLGHYSFKHKADQFEFMLRFG